MHLLLRLLQASHGRSLLVQPLIGSFPWLEALCTPPVAEFGSMGSVALGDQTYAGLPGGERLMDDIVRFLPGEFEDRKLVDIARCTSVGVIVSRFWQ